MLSAQCEELRRRHSEALLNQGSVEKRLSQVGIEKQTLLVSIEDTRRNITQLMNDKDLIQVELREVGGDIAKERATQVILFIY